MFHNPVVVSLSLDQSSNCSDGKWPENIVVANIAPHSDLIFDAASSQEFELLQDDEVIWEEKLRTTHV